MTFSKPNNGKMAPNKYKKTDKHPDFKGNLNVGGTEYWISAWKKNNDWGEYFSLSVEERDLEKYPLKERQEHQRVRDEPKPERSQERIDLDDEIPF